VTHTGILNLRASRADVIVVLVSNQDGIERIRCHAQAREASHGFAQREPAVRKYACRADFKQETIAFAAAA